MHAGGELRTPSDREDNYRISVILPCLNEAGTVGDCVDAAYRAIRNLGLDGEVIVVDNGSTDSSSYVAEKHGARVVHEPKRGYGNAYLRGFREASGDIIVLGDADGTYPLEDIPRFIQPILQGSADFVIGSRLRGRILPGAMPWSHRYLGNPLLSFILNLLFKAGVSDAHCGMRALSREALDKMSLGTPGMEFASEMLIEAKRRGLRIAEVPIEYRPRKGGKPKMSSLKDGWRHLRFMLLYSPTVLFLLPGSILFLLGIFLVAVLVHGPVRIGNIGLDIHPMILGNLFVILGFQVIALGLYTKVYAAIHGISKPDRITRVFLRYDMLEYELLLGSVLLLAGFLVDLNIAIKWVKSGFGELSELRTAIMGSTLAALGVQLIFLGLFMSILLLKKEA
jgi:glycosyltransferase involved in cell wall biosynthesis